MEGQEKKVCFVICPVEGPDSRVRYRSNQVLEFLIKPVVEPMGYEVIRSDLQATPGIITNQILNHVMEAPLVIADLSDAKGNVFYELAVRHIAEKPFVQLLIDGQELPFDIKAMRTVFYDMADPFKIEEKKKELSSHVRAAEDGVPIETPISTALELKAHRSSSDSLERQVGELKEEFAEVRAEMRASRTSHGQPITVVPTAQWRGLAPTHVGGSLNAFYDPQLVGTVAPQVFIANPLVNDEGVTTVPTSPPEVDVRDTPAE